MQIIKGGVTNSKTKLKSKKRQSLRIIRASENNRENADELPYLPSEFHIEQLGEGHFSLRFDDDDELLFSA